MGRDATPGYGPTDAGQGRPTGFDRRRMGRDSPPAFPGRPRPVVHGLDRADERNAGRRYSRSRASAAMAYDAAAAASRGPSIAATFGSEFAAQLNRIGHTR
jgi:hypothetical protein